MAASSGAKRPNFLIVVADDLGFSDTQPYGSEISTPNLDALAREGLRMTDFHTAPMCSPTRAMLLSGTDNHIAGLGAMWEQMRSTPDIYKGRRGYEGYLNFDVAALPEVLRDAGYFTVISGKWHLGMQREVAPCSRGFQKSFTYLAGAGNHYNNEPQLDDDVPRLPSLCGDGLWMQGDQFLDRKTDLPKDFYSTKTFTDKMLSFLEERTADEKSSPFFAYLAYTAPHWPLQAPKAAIKKYQGKYDDGPRALQLRRLAALQDLGLVPKGVEPAPIVAMGTRPWDQLSSEEKARSARAMEIYAAMVDQLDAHLGRVLAYLRATHELDNTFVLFISDNGAEGHILEATPVLGQSSLAAVIARHYDNSLANMGAASSCVWYGPRWACAATAPSRGFKAWSTEGGIRCPAILRFPPGVHRPPGSVSHAFATVMDVMPTVLELAGVAHPHPRFQGRDVVAMRGRSWVQHLAGQAEEVHNDSDGANTTCWELFGVRAVRRGAWKAVYLAPPKGQGAWELYNLALDPGEVHDCSGERPALLAELIEHYELFYQETGMFDAGLAVEMAEKRAAEVLGEFKGWAGDGLYYD